MDRPMQQLPLPVQQKVESIFERLEHLPRHDSPETRLALVEIIRDIVIARDRLIGIKRRGETCEDYLKKINAVLSAMFGIEYPINGLQWKRLTAARAALKNLRLGQPRDAKSEPPLY